MYHENTPDASQKQPPEQMTQGRMDPCCHAVYAKLWTYYLNLTAEIEIYIFQYAFL